VQPPADADIALAKVTASLCLLDQLEVGNLSCLSEAADREPIPAWTTRALTLDRTDLVSTLRIMALEAAAAGVKELEQALAGRRQFEGVGGKESTR